MKITADEIKKCATDVGFQLCGVTPIVKLPFFTREVNDWVKKRYHASMEWITRNEQLREDASLFFEGACSVIVCAVSYLSENKPYGIARYAYGEDYHYVVKRMLLDLLRLLQERFGKKIQARAFVDSAPLAEKIYAVKAGLGWLGKNSLLINKHWGSFLFLGELIVDLIPENYDSPQDSEGCGNCERCMLACPGKALIVPRCLDARRCISYLTIEHKGIFSDEQLSLVRSSVSFFGCDVCQEVCPYNQKVLKQMNRETVNNIDCRFNRRKYTFPEESLEWLNMKPEYFKQNFGDTPLARAKLEGIQRNIKTHQSD